MLAKRRYWFIAVLALALCSWMMAGKPLLAQDVPVAQRLQSMAAQAQEGIDAAQEHDTAAMQREYNEIHERWEEFEDQVRDQDPQLYLELENALDGVKDAVNANPVDSAAAASAYDHLMDELNLATARLQSGETSGQSQAATQSITPATVLDELDEALAALRQGDGAEGAEHLGFAAQAWPSIEGAVATKSKSDSSAIESDFGAALNALKATPVDLASAEAAVTRIRQTLATYAAPQAYSAFDAAAVILREGLEALLIVVALLALLRRSGNQDKQGWVWAGVALGVLVSIGAGFVLQLLFNQVSAGQNRELIEGITGLVAAAMLFYISYWLHSKSSAVAWQKYIHERTSQLLARGSMVSLATLAFLTVFREGAETTIFYIGMAPSISMSDLLLGLGIGVALLAVIAVLMLVMGVRLPIRLFFFVGGLLVYYLGFKFVGMGIHSLQVAGVVPTAPVPFIPEIPLLGVYPTWPSLIPQLLMLAVAVALVLYLRSKEQKSLAAPAGV
jgi:high-affinity iron transporter